MHGPPFRAQRSERACLRGPWGRGRRRLRVPLRSRERGAWWASRGG